MNKTKHRVQRRTKYLTEFDIDISKLAHGTTIIVKDSLNKKYTVIVVDPKKHLVRVIRKPNKEDQGFTFEGVFKGTQGARVNLISYCWLPVPEGHICTYVEKVRF